MKRHHYISVAVVIGLTVMVLKLPPRAATQFKLAIGSLFLPLFGLSTSTQHLAESTANAVLPRRELLRQNEQLRRENAEMRVQLQHQVEFERENERLRAMLQFQPLQPWKLKAANVIARDPANWWRNVQIDRGKRDGLQPDMPVLTAQGLVGRVAEVSETRARVVIIGDANCRVAAAVWDMQPGARGSQHNEKIDEGVITTGASVLDENIVELGYLSRAIRVKAGQVVRTSGLGGIFPAGIMIGEIIDTRPAEYGLYTVARVKLAVKMNLLDEVWVMMEPRAQAEARQWSSVK